MVASSSDELPEEEEPTDDKNESKAVVIQVEPLPQELASPMQVASGLQLIEFCHRGELTAVRQEADAGAPIGFITTSGWTPVAAAAYGGWTQVLVYLLELEADRMYKTSPSNEKAVTTCTTPLHWACYKGHVDVVSILLAAGYNLEAQDSIGNRCLHLACSGGHKDTVELLLAHGAAVEARNHFGNRALELATEPTCRRLLQCFQAQSSCKWCNELFTPLRRPSLCQHCHNVFCSTSPCSSSTVSTRSRVLDFEEINHRLDHEQASTKFVPERTRRYCQECATDRTKAEENLRHVLEKQQDLILRTLAVLDPSRDNNNQSQSSTQGDQELDPDESKLSSDIEGETAAIESTMKEETAFKVESPIETEVDTSMEHNNDSKKDKQELLRSLPPLDLIRRALTLTRTDAETLCTALEAAELKAVNLELLQFARQTYDQLLAHLALQEQVKALLAKRPLGIRAMLDPLQRALQAAIHHQVHHVLLSLARQVIQSAQVECTLFGCHALCANIQVGSRRYSKEIARLEASITIAERRGVSDELLEAAKTLRDRLNAEIRLETALVPLKSSFDHATAATTYVFNDGSIFNTLFQALEYQLHLVSTAVDMGTSIDGVATALLEDANLVLKQVKKEFREETKAEEERRKAAEEAAAKAAKKGKKSKKKKA